MTISQTLTAPPTPVPDKDSMTSAEFQVAADAYHAWTPKNNSEMATWTAQANALKTTMNGYKTDAESAASTAATQVGLAEDQVGLAEDQVDLAVAAKIASEAARDLTQDYLSSAAELAEGTINDAVSTSTSTYSAAKLDADFQPLLVPGTNLKTLNGVSLLGAGDIVTGKLTHTPITTATTLTASHHANHIVCSGTFTLAVTSAVTLGAGWWCYVSKSGSGNITIDPAGAETIDGVASATVEPGDFFLVVSDGINLQCKKISGIKPHYITSSQTWICPAGITQLEVEVQGGGGSGPYRTNTADETYYLLGGCSGGYARKKITITAGTTKTVTIGAGGVAPTSTAVGNAGGTTSFGTDVSATGGGGGIAVLFSSDVHDSILSTTPGVGSGGDINITGERAVVSLYSNNAVLTGVAFFGGKSRFSGQVGMSADINLGRNGSNATGYGGGASGGAVYNASGHADGGDGSGGLCVILY